MTKLPSGKTISVKIIDLVNVIGCPCKYLHTPPVEGIDILPPGPSLSFLLEHESGRKLLFDLGIPKDLTKLGAEVNEDLKTIGYDIHVKDDVAPFLEKHGVALESIEAVIWSHSHWDHKGDMTTFPSSTSLVVGPSTIATFVDGDGNSKLGGVTKNDTEGRRLHEISFDTHVGPFPAMDYFKDGSLYLLDSPGHERGHMCALARTSQGPDTFILLGGDSAHHCAEYRPSKHLPMPEKILPNPRTGSSDTPLVPGNWFRDTNTKRGLNPGDALFKPAWAADMTQTMDSIHKMQELDGDENVLCIISHDSSIRHPAVPMFPEAVNDWKARDLRKFLDWSWVGDLFDVLEKNGIAWS